MSSKEQGAPAQGRIVVPDIIKGFIITVIVLSHFIFQNTGEAGGNTGFSVMQIGFIGLMVFFVISGYFFKPGRSYVENVKKRITKLFLATIVASLVLPLILIPYLMALGQTVDLSTFPDFLLSIFSQRHLFEPLDTTGNTILNYMASTGYYYLQTMVVAFLVFYAVAAWAVRDVKNLAVSIIVALVAEYLMVEVVDMCLPFFAQLAPIAIAFMLFGAYLGDRKVIERFEAGGWKDVRNLVLVIVTLAATFALAYLFPPGMDFFKTYFGAYGGLSVFPYYINAILMVPMMIGLAFLLSKIPLLGKALSCVGKHTLAILLLHCFFVKLLIAPFYTLPNGQWLPALGMPLAVVLGLVTVAVITLLAEYAPGKIASMMDRKKE